MRPQPRSAAFTLSFYADCAGEYQSCRELEENLDRTLTAEMHTHALQYVRQGIHVTSIPRFLTGYKYAQAGKVLRSPGP